MKNFYTLSLAFLSPFAFAQQQETISFETSEGFQLGTIHNQNGWTVTEGSDGFIQNQIITNEKASQGSFSFKNANEPNFGPQFAPILGAVKTFATPKDFSDLTVSYDVLVDQTLGADFEFVLYTVDEDEIFVPVAGVGIENRGMIYLINDENYGFQYATATWTPNQWVNVKIEVKSTEIKYYINNVLQATIANYTQLNIHGFNMLHNNYGHNAYYDNFVITSGGLNVKPFENSSVAVYPNPASEVISLKTAQNIEVNSIEIYNLAGQKVITANQPENIQVSQLSAGTYLLKAKTADGQSVTKKIIKK